MTGCSSNSGDPVSPGVNRNPQIFFPLGIWDDKGYSLDSASSMWLPPTPYEPGDLAVLDIFGEPPNEVEVIPMVTAFVKANRSDEAADAKIRLIAFDMEHTIPPTADLHVDIAADNVANQYFCRHPTVEVTYYRDPEEQFGNLGIHVVWTQWTGYGDQAHWELYYKYFHVLVDHTGIQWGSVLEFPVTAITVLSGGLYDEIQPDLAVDAQNRSMLVIFTQMDVPVPPPDPPPDPFYIILAMQGVIPPAGPVFWNPIVYPVLSGPVDVEKGFPKIDIGVINPDPSLPNLDQYIAFAVWSEWDPILQNFQIWYATADPLFPGIIIGQQLTFSENGIGPDGEYESWDILPSVDIPALSSRSDINANLQAVITYEGADVQRFGQDIYINEQRVYCRITPDLGTEFLLKGDDDHAWLDGFEARTPEVACYQMNDPLATEQWFGVAMHNSVGMIFPADLETYTGSWGYEVDSGGSVTLSDQKDAWHTNVQNPYWNIDHPATGPTIILRYWDPGDPIKDYMFGLGWINGPLEPTEVWLAEGAIWQ